MSNKLSNGRAGSEGPKDLDFGGSSSIVAGLQSVMAVIGETYDPEAGSNIEKPATTMTAAPSVASSKLTDKIDAARTKQGGSAVASGLQSIMAVIGETYEDEPGREELPMPSAPEARPTQTAPARPLDDDERDLLSDLMPLLTSEELEIGHTHHRVTTEVEAVAAEPATALVAAGAAAGATSIEGLLRQLKSDIVKLETENKAQRQQYNMPAVIDNASNEVKSLLAQLQSDISALRNENDALKTRYNIPLSGGGGEVASLLAQLQGDIAKLRNENDALKTQYGIPIGRAGGNSEVASLLAQLQGDIANLRHENDAFKNFYNMPTRQARGTSIGQAFLMTLGLLTLIGGATLGGFYFANRLNDQNKENLLAMVGLQQQAQPEARAPVAATAPAASTQLAAVQPQQAAPVATPAPLPEVNVKQMKLDTAEVQALIKDAENLIDLGDLVSARQMLEYAMSQDSAQATYRLAQTYDPLYLSRIATVLSVAPDVTKAKVLYYSAAAKGHPEAKKRLAELR